MAKKYDVIVPMTKGNLPVFEMNLGWIRKNLDCRRVLVIGAEGLREPCRRLGAEFLHEDQLLEGMSLKAVQGVLESRLGEKKRAGWYFQQFLKLGYAYVCQDEYYIVWDADTVPLHPISHMVNGHPVFTKKDEMEPAYFATLDRLFSGQVKKCGDFSFICENMIMNVEVMKEMLACIMQNPALEGKSFWERILSAVSDQDLPGSGFSEFETYGNYVMKYHPDLYRLRALRGMRKGAEYFGMSPDPKQLAWAAKSYDTIAFEGWSHYHRWLGAVCGSPLVQAIFPFSFLTGMKEKISRMRTG